MKNKIAKNIFSHMWIVMIVAAVLYSIGLAIQEDGFFEVIKFIGIIVGAFLCCTSIIIWCVDKIDFDKEDDEDV